MNAALLGASTNLSGNELLLSLLIAAVFGFLGYRISSRHRVLRGVTPWRFPSLVWALICFAIGPLGIVVELVAEVTTKPRLPSSLGRIGARFDGSARLGRNAQLPPPPPPQSAPIAPPFEEAPVPAGPPAPRDSSGTVLPFGWYQDPTARHQHRYFDGRGWSEFVSDDGVRSNDPL